MNSTKWVFVTQFIQSQWNSNLLRDVKDKMEHDTMHMVQQTEYHITALPCRFSQLLESTTEWWCVFLFTDSCSCGGCTLHFCVLVCVSQSPVWLQVRKKIVSLVFVFLSCKRWARFINYHMLIVEVNVVVP